MSLKGKRVLVVGGGSGIGLAVAERAIEEGAQVVVASSNAEKVGRVAAQLGKAATGSVLDVTEELAVAQFFSTEVLFDHIAFTAGDWQGFGPGRLVDLDLAKAPQGLNVRFWGAFAVAKYGAGCIPPGGSLTLTSGMCRTAGEGLSSCDSSAWSNRIAVPWSRSRPRAFTCELCLLRLHPNRGAHDRQQRRPTSPHDRAPANSAARRTF